MQSVPSFQDISNIALAPPYAALISSLMSSLQITSSEQAKRGSITPLPGQILPSPVALRVNKAADRGENNAKKSLETGCESEKINSEESGMDTLGERTPTPMKENLGEGFKKKWWTNDEVSIFIVKLLSRR